MLLCIGGCWSVCLLCLCVVLVYLMFGVLIRFGFGLSKFGVLFTLVRCSLLCAICYCCLPLICCVLLVICLCFDCVCLLWTDVVSVFWY